MARATFDLMPFDENTNFIISQSMLEDVLAQLGVYVALVNIRT